MNISGVQLTKAQFNERGYGFGFDELDTNRDGLINESDIAKSGNHEAFIRQVLTDSVMDSAYTSFNNDLPQFLNSLNSEGICLYVYGHPGCSACDMMYPYFDEAFSALGDKYTNFVPNCGSVLTATSKTIKNIKKRVTSCTSGFGGAPYGGYPSLFIIKDGNLIGEITKVTLLANKDDLANFIDYAINELTVNSTDATTPSVTPENSENKTTPENNNKTLDTLRAQLAENNDLLNQLTGKIHYIKDEITSLIEQAIKASKEIEENKKAQAAEILQESIDRYAISEGEMTYSQFENYLTSRLNSLENGTTGKISGVITRLLRSEQKMSELSGFVNQYSKITAYSKTIAEQITAQSKETISTIEIQKKNLAGFQSTISNLKQNQSTAWSEFSIQKTNLNLVEKAKAQAIKDAEKIQELLDEKIQY